MHTVADWDFEQGANYRTLSATQYVSSPTSLLLWSDPGVWVNNTVLCRVAETLCLPQGELRTWLWSAIGWRNSIFFRHQSALGSAERDNCYLINPEPLAWVVRRIIAGSDVHIGTVEAVQPLNEWWHFRVVWWNGYTPEAEPALCINLYKEIEGEWVQQGDTIYDTLNQWADSEINRVGIGTHSYTGNLQYFDDTEIWAPIA